MKRMLLPYYCRSGILVLLLSFTLLTIAAAAEPWLPAVVHIPAGAFIAGSDSEERETAYRLDEAAYGSPLTREQRWYDAERPRGQAQSAAYAISVTPITNRQYAAFIAATGHRPPAVMRATWESYGLSHPYERTRRFAWTGRRPPAGRDEHPVVMVSQADANAYAAWLSRRTGQVWRLPIEPEWEKAARGVDGRYFPWGWKFAPARLNSHDAGPSDTAPVGRYPADASPYGVLDGAGQVFEWTASAAGSGAPSSTGAHGTTKVAACAGRRRATGARSGSSTS
ncbi:MAG: formylglycine-generating enzyme family protein [Burkholderiaceae bacterium]